MAGSRSCAVLAILALVAIIGPAMGQTTSSLAPVPPGTFVRAACVMGKPPFTDAADRTNSTSGCTGLFYTIFQTVMSGIANVQYNVTLVDVADELALVVPNATNETYYDFVIAASTISPRGLSLDLQYSISMYETYYRFALRPSYRQSAAGFESTVLRDSVWYLLSIVCLFAFAFAIFVLPLELRRPKSDLAQIPRWRQPLTAVEQGLELMLTNATSIDLAHQGSRSIRTIISICALFVVMIFGAIITAQLTSSSTSVTDVKLGTLKGHKIAHAFGPDMSRYLRSPPFEAVVVQIDDVETFAEQWYQGGFADIDGFFAEAAVVEFLHTSNEGDIEGFVLSETFSHHGSPDLKAFPMSPNLNENFRLNFDAGCANIRDNGVLDTLTQQDILVYTPVVPNDVTVDEDLYLGLLISSSVLFGIYTVIGLVFMVLHFVLVRRQAARDGDGAPDDDRKSISVRGDRQPLRWRGVAVSSVDPEVEAMLDGLVRKSKKR